MIKIVIRQMSMKLFNILLQLTPAPLMSILMSSHHMEIGMLENK